MRQFGETGFNVARVHNAETASIAQAVGFLQQDALTEAVEGRNFQTPGDFFPQQPGHALFHLARCLVGEGDGTDMLRGIAMVDKPGDFAGDHTGFATAGASQHQAGPINTFNRLALRLIEIFQVQG